MQGPNAITLDNNSAYLSYNGTMALFEHPFDCFVERPPTTPHYGDATTVSSFKRVHQRPQFAQTSDLEANTRSRKARITRFWLRKGPSYLRLSGTQYVVTLSKGLFSNCHNLKQRILEGLALAAFAARCFVLLYQPLTVGVALLKDKNRSQRSEVA